VSNLQQDLLPTISVIIASVSVTLGVIYYLLNSRKARKREQIDMAMRVYMTYNNNEFHTADALLLSTEFTDYTEFTKKYGSPLGQEPIPLALRKVINAYELLGFLLYHNLIDLSMVQSHFRVEEHWEKVQPIIEAGRTAYNDPKFYEYFEYLYNEWISVQNK
jgi:hypothetical protein